MESGSRRSKFAGSDVPHDKDGNQIQENAKDEGPEITLGLIEDIPRRPCPQSSTQSDASFYHSVDQSEMPPFIEVCCNRHEHRGCGSPSGAEEKNEKVEEGCGRHSLENQKK